MLKVTIKYLYCCFCAKTQYSFILDYRGVREGGKGVKGVGINGFRGKLLKYLNMWVMLFLTEGSFFPKMEKFTPSIKDKKGP